MAWRAKEGLQAIYRISHAHAVVEFVAQFRADLQDRFCPPEAKSLGPTLVRWRDEIVTLAERLRDQPPLGGGQQPNQAHEEVRVPPFAHWYSALAEPTRDLLATVTPR